MKTKFFNTRLLWLITLTLSVLLTLPALPGCKSKAGMSAADPNTTSSPVVNNTGELNFGKILQGKEITHNFILKNTGEKKMEFKQAKPGWLVYVASMPKTLPPGEEAPVTVKVVTEPEGGKVVDETVELIPANSDTPAVILKIKGEIQKFVDISPRRIKLKGYLGDKISQVLTIIPADAHPFTITGVRAKKGEHIKISRKETKIQGKRAYLLTVDNIRTRKGFYRDSIYIQTDSKVRPEFRIRLDGELKERE